MNAAEVEAKKGKFRDFLKLMGKGAGTTKEKQSWNDQFENFMHFGRQMPSHKDNTEAKDGEDGEAEEGQEEEKKEGEQAEEEGDNLIDDKRLFVMNLSFKVTKEELTDLFGKYGEVVDIEIPFRKYGKGVPLGIGFVRFVTSESAIQAYAELDKIYF